MSANVTAGHMMSSVLSMLASMIKTVPNEEFGVLGQWMAKEANRRADAIRGRLRPGTEVVWASTTGNLTKGSIVSVGSKNALCRSERGGELHVPLARLELHSVAAPRIAGLCKCEAPQAGSGARAA